MQKEYICKRCGYKTQYKHSLIKHLEKIVECTIKLDNIDRDILLNNLKEREKKTIIEKIYLCKFCSKKLTTRQNKWKHEKICKDKDKDKDTTKNLSNEELENLVINLSKKIEILENNKQNITNNNITNNITNNINNPIIITDLRPFGKENYEHITEEFIKKNIRPSRELLFKLFKKLHFNLNHPENWNFYISNSRSNTANVYRGKRFEIEDKHKSIKELVDNIIKFCKTFVVDLESLTELDKQILLESFENYEGLNLNNDDYKYDIKGLIQSISTWAYNKKEKIELTKKEIDKINREETKIILDFSKVE